MRMRIATTPSTITAFVLSLGLTLLLTAAAAACPTCKDAVADGPHGGDLVRGFGWSIIFMMSTPFLVFSGICAYFYYEILKARRQSHQRSELPSAMHG